MILEGRRVNGNLLISLFDGGLLLLGTSLGLLRRLDTGAGHEMGEDLGLLQQEVKAFPAVRCDFVLKLCLARGRSLIDVIGF